MIVAEETALSLSHIGEHLGHRAQTQIIRPAVILRVSKRHTVHTARARRRRSVHRTALNCDIISVRVSHRTALRRVIRCALDRFAIVCQIARAARTAVHDVMRVRVLVHFPNAVRLIHIVLATAAAPALVIGRIIIIENDAVTARTLRVSVRGLGAVNGVGKHAEIVVILTRRIFIEQRNL